MEGGVIAVISKEGGLFGGRVFGIVENELGEGKVIDPIVLLVGTIGLKVGLECLVCSFGKTISTRVIGSGVSSLDIESRGECGPEV